MIELMEHNTLAPPSADEPRRNMRVGAVARLQMMQVEDAEQVFLFARVVEVTATGYLCVVLPPGSQWLIAGARIVMTFGQVLEVRS